MNGPKRAYILVTLFFISILILSYYYGGRSGLIWGFFTSLTVHWLLFFHGTQRLLTLFAARPVEGQDPWGLTDQLKSLSKKARIPQPSIYISDSNFPSAYSVAHKQQKSSIIISSKLLSFLDSDEREAILAYQISQIKELQTVNLSLGCSLMSLLWLPFWWVSYKSNSPQIFSSALRIWSTLVWPIAYLIRKLAVDSDLYYLADARAADLVSNPKALASALWKLDSYAQTESFFLLPSTAHLFVVNPLTKSSIDRYFQAQPSVEKRVRKLIGYYPV